MSMKPDFELDQVRLFNCDCMDFMAEIPDKHYELAIIDTPYGIGAGNMVMGKGKNKKWGNDKDWDNNTPDNSYFAVLPMRSASQRGLRL